MKRSLMIFIMVVLVLAAAVFGLVMSGGAFGAKDVETVTVSQPLVEEPAQAESADAGTSLVFSTTALDGTAVDESIFEGKKLIMLNFWEPWCGPCVGEMPDLQKISEEYSDKGFLIVGVFSTEDGTQEIVDKLGISYPIIRFCDSFVPFQTGYVPTTVFVDDEGNSVSDPVVGSKSYEGWKALIDSLLA